MDAVTGMAELTLQARDPEGNVVEARDLFERDGGSVAALRG